MKSLTSVIIKNSKRPEKMSINILSILAFVIVFGFLGAIMCFVSYKVTNILIELNQPYAFINILLLMNFFIVFEKGIFDSLNCLYFSADLKVLLKMPIKSRDIVKAKIINMIISEWPAEILMIAIPMIVYGILSKVGIMFYIYMSIILLIIPIIPIMTMSFIISVIMRFTNKIKNKTKIVYIVIGLTIGIVTLFVAGLNIQGDISSNEIENILLQANGLAEGISDILVIIKPIMNSLMNYNNVDGLKNILLFLLENIICFVVILEFISLIYYRGAIGTTINSNKKIRNIGEHLNIKELKLKTVQKSYLIKEIKTMIRTPIFCIQCLIMPMIYSSSIFFISNAIISFSQKMGVDLIEGLKTLLSSYVGFIVFISIGQILFMMNFSSIIAISRESKCFFLEKYIPITAFKQFKIKTIIGKIINLISTIIVSYLSYLYIGNFVESIVIFICLTILNVITEELKLLLDYMNPKINWDSEYTMMKQNTNVMYSLFYTIFVIGLIAIFSKIISNLTIIYISLIWVLLIIRIITNEKIKKVVI